MADLTPDQLDALAKGIAASGIAQETTLKALVKALGGSTGMAAVAQATGKTAKEMKTVGSYLQDLSEDLEETSTGLNKYAKLQNSINIGVTLATGKLNDLGSTVRVATGQMGIFGQSVGYAASTLLDALADNVDFYRQLSTVGATAGQSISDLRRVSGLTGLTMGQLTQAVAAAQGNLALLGGTAGQGFQRFSQALIELSQGETFEKLTGLGFTMDRIAEGAGEYLEIQTQLGRTQIMTSRDLASGADEYLTNLDLLTRLTGKNRDMLAQEMKQNAADNRLKIQMAGMDQKQQAVIQRALSLTDKGSQELGQSLRNLIATGGIPTNAREAGIMQLQGFSEALDRVSRGESGSVEQLMSVFQTAALETGNLSAEERQRFAQLKQFGVDFFDVRFETIAFKNALGDLQQVTEEQKKAQEAAGTSALQFDRATQRLRTAFAAVLAPATTLIAKAFEGIAFVLEGLGSMVSFVTEKLGEMGGAVVGILGLLGVGAGGAFLTKQAGKGLSTAGSYLTGGGGGGSVSRIGANVGGLAKGIGAGAGKVFSLLGRALGTLANPKILLGASIIAGSIAVLGAGIAGATYLMGGALQKFTTGIEGLTNIDGQGLKDTADGLKTLAGAMVKMGSATSASATGFFGKLFGGGPENFAKSINATLDSLDKGKIDLYANSLSNLGEAMNSLNTGMSGTITTSATETGNKLDKLNTTMEQVLMMMSENNKFAKNVSDNTKVVADNT
jgi:hypothetical protein